LFQDNIANNNKGWRNSGSSKICMWLFWAFLKIINLFFISIAKSKHFVKWYCDSYLQLFVSWVLRYATHT